MSETGVINQTEADVQGVPGETTQIHPGNPHLAKARKNRTKRAEDPFYIHLGPVTRLLRDKYNLTVAKLMRGTNGKYLKPEAHLSTIQGVINHLKSRIGDTSRIEERLKGIKTYYEKGQLKIELPEGFEFDAKDIEDQDEEREHER